jgi:hypothetical protein
VAQAEKILAVEVVVADTVQDGAEKAEVVLLL